MLDFSQVRNGAARMKQMHDDVQQFVRPEGAGAVRNVAVDLDEVADEVRSALSARIQASGARIVVGPLGSIRGQRALMVLVLQNLVTNAIKFMPAGRQRLVEVFATRGDGRTRLSVRDNEIGIDAAKIG